MSEEHYKDELLRLVELWTVEQLDSYIQSLEDRISDTRGQISALKIIRKRKTRNKDSKDTGTRGGL